MKAGAAKCYTLISEQKRNSVFNLVEKNRRQCQNENQGPVVFVHHLSQVIDRVDVIIHDWNEEQILALSNLTQLIKARDQCLVPKGGCMVPHEIRLQLGAMTDSTFENYAQEQWDFSKYGLDYSHVADVSLRTNVFWGPLMNPLVSPKINLLAIKPMTMSLNQVLNYSTSFFLELSQNCTVSGLALYLEVRFIATISSTMGWKPCHQRDPYTFILSKPIESCRANELIQGTFSYSVQNKKIATEVKTVIKLKDVTSEFLLTEIRKDTMIS